VVSIRVLGSVRGCEDGLTRHRSVDCHPGRGLVGGGAGGGEPCLHMLAYVHGRDPHCKLPPRTAEGARWKVGCTKGEEASVGVVGVQHTEKLGGHTPTHV
jgi:hypothetical protein